MAPVDTRWQSEAKAIRVNREGLRDLYVSAMEPSKYESAALVAVHTFCDRSQASSDARLAVCVGVWGCGWLAVCGGVYVLLPVQIS